MSGSQIGGAVGAVVGGFIGFYTGNIGAGVQYGYAIGSAIGGYVDPNKSYGPRLEDAGVQTSTVGGVIPYGFGVFVVHGNVIWADELKEHRKRERAGKGSQVNYTYHYTRSYAIGVAKGELSRWLWVKRNGKLIYSSDPAGLGEMLGWDSAQVADLVASSNEFLERATFYAGSLTQMPDPTIVAVEGMGNVAPFRGLAYVSIAHDDLTDMQGAVAIHEFCVERGAARIVTSHPYMAYSPESFATNVTYGESGTLPTEFSEQFGSSVEYVSSELSQLLKETKFELGDMVSSGSYIDSELQQILYIAEPSIDEIEGSVAYVGSVLEETLIIYNHPDEAIVGSVSHIGSSINEP